MIKDMFNYARQKVKGLKVIFHLNKKNLKGGVLRNIGK